MHAHAGVAEACPDCGSGQVSKKLSETASLENLDAPQLVQMVCTPCGREFDAVPAE